METMMQEEFMNNCATRTVLSGVMGLGLGVLFGIFMGSMDGAVSLKPILPCPMLPKHVQLLVGWRLPHAPAAGLDAVFFMCTRARVCTSMTW